MLGRQIYYLRLVTQIIDDQQGLILIFARVRGQVGIIGLQPVHAAAAKRRMSFADMDHAADRMKERVLICDLAGNVDSLIPQIAVDKFRKWLASAEAAIR